MKKVPGLGPKAFEQCAGFLKIAESSDPLDNTWVHPENYDAAREVLPKIQNGEKITASERKALAEKYNISEITINDIIDELQKPNRDPRDGYPAPIMQKGVLQFEDLKEGMKVTGKIRNVVDFGAFVDIGLHETGLVHLSEMSDSFVENPMDVVKVGDVFEFTIIQLDVDRRRIGLSLKSDAASRAGTGAKSAPTRSASVGGSSSGAGSSGGKKVVVVKKGSGAASANKANNSFKNTESRRKDDDDGMSYNPFAAFFNNK